LKSCDKEVTEKFFLELTAETGIITKMTSRAYVINLKMLDHKKFQSIP